MALTRGELHDPDTHFDQVIPANSFAEGVPAVVKKQESIRSKQGSM